MFGPSGSGKTTEAFRRIIERSEQEKERRFYIIAPEQYGMLLQKQYLAMHPGHASGNVEVMSFNRLGWSVFHELDVKLPPLLDDTGKAMVIRRAASALGDKLTLFRGRMKRAGFTGQVKSMLSEFSQYGVKPEVLLRISDPGTEAGEDAPGRSALKLPLRQKLSDLGLISEWVTDFIDGKGILREDVLNMLAEAVSRSALVKDASFLFDGFTGFTPVQYSVINRLMETADSLTFTVTVGTGAVPYGAPETEALFAMSQEMTRRISDLAASHGGTHEKDIFLKEPKRQKDNPPLLFLEKHLFRYDGAVYPEGKADAICLTPAVNAAEEIRRAAAEILRLVRTEGYRYREIAVVTSDKEQYEPLLQEECALQKIPLYLDSTMDVSSNPLPELLRSAVFCVTDRFSARSFLRFLKCGLVSEEEETEAGLMWRADLYMEHCGIRGIGKLSAPWEYLPEGMDEDALKALNAYKDRTLSLLLPLKECFTGGKAPVGKTAASLRSLMEAVGASGKLSVLAEGFREAGDAASFRTYSAVYGEMERVLLEMEELLPDEMLTPEEMSGILDAGIREIRVGGIPAYADRISAGDLTRSRFGEIRALFLLGANDGLLPALKPPSGILNDREKEALKHLGITLSPTQREDLSMQRYYLYRILTAPKDRLYLSFPVQDKNGKALRPAGVVNHLERLFPGLAAIREDDRLYSEIQAERQVVRLLRDARLEEEARPDGKSLPEAAWKKEAEDILPGYAKTERGRRALKDLLSAASFYYRPRTLSPGTAAALYGTEIGGSVTRIETFFSCPFRQFARYGLLLMETDPFDFSAKDQGTLAHRALEILFRRAEKEGIRLPELTKEARSELAVSCAREAAEEDRRGLYRDDERSKWMAGLLADTVALSADVLSEQLSKGKYTPFALEQHFNAENNPGALRIPLECGGTLSLNGTVDRIDLGETEDGRIAVKIMDYKTGSTKFEPYRLLSGAQIQLLLYLGASLDLVRERFKGREVVPGAVLYTPVFTPRLPKGEIHSEEEAFQGVLKELKPSGLVNMEESALKLLSQDPAVISLLYPLKQEKKSGALSGDSAVDSDRFSSILRHVKRKAGEAGNRILSGDLSVSPLLEGTHDPCAYCPYPAVCRYDRKSGGYRYRRNGKQKAADVWAEIDREEEEEDRKGGAGDAGVDG